MFLAHLIVGILGCASLAFGGVDFAEKSKRIDFISKLSAENEVKMPEVFERELHYDTLGLSNEERADLEANLIIEKIKKEITEAFETSVQRGMEQAETVVEIKESLQNEFEFVDQDVRAELLNYSFTIIDELSRGGSSYPIQLESLERSLLKGIIERSRYLDTQDPSLSESAFQKNLNSEVFSSKEAILRSLVSDKDNAGWITVANTAVSSTMQKKHEHQIKLKIGLEFRGASLDIGPSISFKREYTSQVNLIAEGLYPLFDENGNFDFVKRDGLRRPILKNGKVQKGAITFNCDAGLTFETADTFSAGVTFVVPGYDYTYERKFTNKVDFASRRVNLPEYIGGKAVTMNYLISLCHNDFLNTKVSGNLTVAGSLNVTMKNMISGIRIRNAKTKCARDTHCNSWYNNLGLVRVNNVPRCVLDEKTGEFATCTLRGLRGQACAVIENGRRVSDNMFERICDKGLRCVKVSNGGWFQGGITGRLWTAPKGECR